MYSVIINKKVLDIRYKKLKYNTVYSIYLGDIYIGQAHKLKNTWSAVTSIGHSLFPINGFRARIDVVELLVKIYKQQKVKDNEF